MAEVGFHRGQRAGAIDAVDLGQAGVFDRVAHRGTGPVRLDHADGAGIDARDGQRRPIHRGLRCHRRVWRCSTVWPSWLAALPRTTARIRSPSRARRAGA